MDVHGALAAGDLLYEQGAARVVPGSKVAERNARQRKLSNYPTHV
jgi:hypothetical protein